MGFATILCGSGHCPLYKCIFQNSGLCVNSNMVAVAVFACIWWVGGRGYLVHLVILLLLINICKKVFLLNNIYIENIK